MSQFELDGVYVGRGGSRPGAGRPKKDMPDTKAMRVPTDYADKQKIADLIALHQMVQDWRYRSDDAAETSPRWEQMRKFLAEVQAKTTLLDIPF